MGNRQSITGRDYYVDYSQMLNNCLSAVRYTSKLYAFNSGLDINGVKTTKTEFYENLIEKANFMYKSLAEHKHLRKIAFELVPAMLTSVSSISPFSMHVSNTARLQREYVDGIVKMLMSISTSVNYFVTLVESDYAKFKAQNKNNVNIQEYLMSLSHRMDGQFLILLATEYVSELTEKNEGVSKQNITAGGNLVEL